ncbi:MAG: nucleotidyltransferase domain-containing protein [Lachnospiraceae bacterium]|nr:nucleotidyltransferase domain-containing protein [Lachnospiraceae bacterium]
MPDRKKKLLEKYIEIIKNIYGSKLYSIILFGSYARGDNSDKSDIDIMILVDMDAETSMRYFNQLSDDTFDFNLDNDLDIEPIAIPKTQFDYWVDAYPFYKNVQNEGVTLYAA